MKNLIRTLSVMMIIFIMITMLGCENTASDEKKADDTPPTITLDEWLKLGYDKKSYSYYTHNSNGNATPSDAPDVDYTAADVKAYAEKSSYTLQEFKDGKIKIYLHPEEHYDGDVVLYVAPCFDKLENGEWKRVYYFTEPLYNRTLHWLPYTPEMMPVEENVVFENFYPRPDVGTYRRIFFMGNGCEVYAEFEITN